MANNIKKSCVSVLFLILVSNSIKTNINDPNIIFWMYVRKGDISPYLF